MPTIRFRHSALVLATIASAAPSLAQTTVHVALDYHAPTAGAPKPNFSPKGTQIALTAAPSTMVLPEGAVRPAKTGMIEIGPDKRSWIPVLVTASADHPSDLTRVYVDRNRNQNFGDDGPALVAAPTQNPKTHAWWVTIDSASLQARYADGSTQPYQVSFWLVRDDTLPAPDIMRYSVRSWRSGRTVVRGIPALVAVMDDDNNAVFNKNDMWSVFPADSVGADKAVLTIDEARETSRFMFLPDHGKDLVLQFKSISPDGKSIDFDVVDKPVTKAADRLPDDLLRNERPRPRTTTPVAWSHNAPGLSAAMAKAKESGKRILLDFEATWCGPCHTMDQWIWNDAEVATRINAAYVGVKIDVDLEPSLVKKYKTTGYPTMILLDSNGKEIRRIMDYQSSLQMLKLLAE